MVVNKELIQKVEDIARLRLTEAEIKEFQPQLDEVLKAFSNIKDVKTDNTEPSFQPVELKNRLKDDKTKECLTQEKALSNTDNKKDSYFKGPRAV